MCVRGGQEGREDTLPAVFSCFTEAPMESSHLFFEGATVISNLQSKNLQFREGK